jgi:8-hydroxy-5-deazaflavin:NADPH oxidoreductase
MKIGILGSGLVGTTLASGFLKHGHEVMIGTRDPAKLASWVKENPKAQIKSAPEAAKFAEVVVLAVKGTAALAAVASAGEENLSGKPVIDTTNPIAEKPPTKGVLEYFTGPNESLMEKLQTTYKKVKFVKAFNSIGAPGMVNPNFSGGKPSMFIAGDDASAKATVRGILDQLGWETEDLGAVEAARAIEPLGILWCIPGFLNNDWNHAFKVLR